MVRGGSGEHNGDYVESDNAIDAATITSMINFLVCHSKYIVC